MERDRLPESAASVLVHLHRVRATKETRNDEGAELADEGPGDFLLCSEFGEVNGVAFEEMSFAKKANSYKLTGLDNLFCPIFNDRQLYNFVGSLYLARHFAHPVNRSRFLSSNQDFTENQLLKLVRRCNLDNAAPALSPGIIKLMNKLLETKYITHQPAKHTLENEHLSPLLRRLRERQRVLAAESDKEVVFHAGVVVKHFRRLEKKIVRLYKMAHLGPLRHVSEFQRCRIEQAFPLSEEEAARLLAAARVNGFFFDLISSKPPESKCISHEQALFECAEHARLWLLNSRLRVYYNFPFTYCDLARGSAPGSKEVEAWNSPAGYKVCLPSYEEKLMRREALAAHWDELENPPEHRDPGLRKVPEIAEDSVLRIRMHDVEEKYEAFQRFVSDEENGDTLPVEAPVPVPVPAPVPATTLTLKRDAEQAQLRRRTAKKDVDAAAQLASRKQIVEPAKRVRLTVAEKRAKRTKKS